MTSDEKLFYFQCKKCIQNQKYSLCNFCHQNYHLQCFNNQSDNYLLKNGYV